MEENDSRRYQYGSLELHQKYDAHDILAHEAKRIKQVRVLANV